MHADELHFEVSIQNAIGQYSNMQGVPSWSRRTLLALPTTLLLTPPLEARAATSTLFVIARSKNANIIHYQANLTKAGRLDLSEPMIAYWVLHAQDGRREGLTWPERELAYGWRLASSVSENGFRFRLKAFEGRDVVVRPIGKNRYCAGMTILRRSAVLRRIFVAADDGSLMPSVRYVEIHGTDLRTREPLLERIEP